HPIALKRRGSQSAFSLGIHEGELEFSVALESGKTVRARAPIEAGRWTHVAGLYDGRFLALLADGELVGLVAAAGTPRNVNAPIPVGGTSQTQFFAGAIDELWISTEPTTRDQLAALSCIRGPASVSITPLEPAAVPPDTTVTYSLVVSNNDVGVCA